MVMFDDVAYPAYRLVQLNSMTCLACFFFISCEFIIMVYDMYIHYIYVIHTHIYIRIISLCTIYGIYIYILYVHFYTYMVLDTTPKGVIM